MRLLLIALRNGILGGVLMAVLGRVFDQVLYYLTGYLLLLAIIGVVASTAITARKSQPAINLARLVLICWGACVITLVTNFLLQWAYKPQEGDGFTRALENGDLLLGLLLGGVLSALVVSSLLLGKRILGKARQG